MVQTDEFQPIVRRITALAFPPQPHAGPNRIGTELFGRRFIVSAFRLFVFVSAFVFWARCSEKVAVGLICFEQVPRLEYFYSLALAFSPRWFPFLFFFS